MATLPESVDYTNKDFKALRARLIALVKSVFPDWTDFDVASFGNLLVDLYAFVGDVLTFYQDSLAPAVSREEESPVGAIVQVRARGAWLVSTTANVTN